MKHAKLVLIGLLAVVGLCFLKTSNVNAVNQNYSSLPQDQMNYFYYAYTSSDGNTKFPQTTSTNSSTGNPCTSGPGYEFDNAQIAWLSAAGQSTNNNNIIASGSSLSLQLNSLGGVCDKFINSSGNISNTNLLTTQFNVVGAPSTDSSNWFLSFSTPGTTINSYSSAYTGNNRFTALSAKTFNVSGVSGFGPGIHSFNVYIPMKIVNQFTNGYLCVANQQQTSNLSGASCPTTNLLLTVQVNIPNTGVCSLSAPAIVPMGSSFTSNFTATNTGGASWGVSPGYYALGSAEDGQGHGIDNTSWGKKREYIQGSGVRASGFGPVLDAGVSTSWSDTFTAPNKPGAYNFQWRLINDNTGQELGRCAQTIYVTANSPYIRATNNDVWAGALFQSSTSDNSCSYSTTDPYTSGIVSKASAAPMTVNNLNTPDQITMAFLTVDRIFQATLGRSPDTSGEAHWALSLIGNPSYNQDTAQIIKGVMATSEYTSTGLGKYGTNWSQLVTQLYINALGRNPESQAAVNSWVTQITSLINNGMSSQDAVASVIKYFVYTGENKIFSLNGIYGMNYTSNVPYNFGGSGSDYGVFSTGSNLVYTILGFIGRNGAARSIDNYLVGSRFDLNFSNVADQYGKSNLYGYFTNTPLCLSDYYDQIQANPDSAQVLPAQSTLSLPTTPGNYIIPFNGSSIGSVTVNPGVNVAVLSSSSVTINGNVNYGGYGGGSSPSWPAFMLVVKGGDINITSAATHLAGTYIAQPGTQQSGGVATMTSGGTINTCSDVSSNPTVNGACANQLKVDGSLIGQVLTLNRLYGSTGYSNRGGNPTNATTTTCLPLTGYGVLPSGYSSGLVTSAGNQAFGVAQEYDYLYNNQNGRVNQCAGEWVNFDPSTYFTHISSSSDTGLPQSLQELPPIY